jgi:Uma2 family endonuclease
MNVRVTNGAEGLARRAFTVEEIRRMVEAGIAAPQERFEPIEGELVPLSPKGPAHETVKSALR